MTEFDQWYRHYPKKVSRGRAIKAFIKARRKVDLETLIEATKKYVRNIAETDTQFIPYPATWLNDERWLDEPCAKEPASKTVANTGPAENATEDEIAAYRRKYGSGDPPQWWVDYHRRWA